MVYTLPNGSQFVMLYPLLVPTDTHEKSWLKLANSMLAFVRSTMVAAVMAVRTLS